MNVIIHYPGKLHIERECDYSGSFNSIWLKIIHDNNELQQFVSIDEFFSKFLVYRNGTRLWNASTYCTKADNIIIVAINKGSVVPLSKPNVTKVKTCTCCKKEDAVFIDEFNILTYEKREEGRSLKLAYCKDCFTKAVKEFAFKNIRKKEPLSGITVDIGLSGERDSTIAAYFLASYKEQYGTNIDIKCVYNNIGLGNYDDKRQKSAENVAKEYGFDFKVNYVDIGMLDELYKNDTAGTMNTRYCNMCTYLTGFREYGEYANIRVLSATGSRTLEDDFVSKIYGTYSDDTKTLVNRIYVLRGLSEDIISLYAAISNINYYVGDCPLQVSSPHYFCRKLAVNPLKAISKWVYKQEDKYEELKMTSPFGYVSSKRDISYFAKCIKRSDGEWVDLQNISIADYKDLEEEHLKERYKEVDILDKRFYEIRQASESKWLRDKVNSFKVAMKEDEMKSQNIYLNSGLNFLITKYVLLYITKRDYKIVLVSINNIEEHIISKLLGVKDNNGLAIKQLDEYFSSENYDEYVLCLYRLLINGIICISKEKREKDRDINVLFYDKYKLFSEPERSELIEVLNLSENQIVFQNSMDEINNPNKIYRFAICISYDINDLIRFESKLNESNVKTIKIFVHPSDIITILKGSLAALNEKYAPLDIVWKNNQIEISKFYKKQVLYILSDMINFENRINSIEKPNVLNTINTGTMIKKQIEF